MRRVLRVVFRLNQLSQKAVITVKMPFYAVGKGKSTGIFETWEACKRQVDGYPGAKFKKFYERHQAEDFLKTFENKIKEETPELKQETGMPFVDFWPDDVSADEEDDFLLASVAANFDDTQSRKRKGSASQEPEKLRKDSHVYKSVEQKMFGNYLLPVDSEGYVQVYTDGSCEGNGLHNAVAGLGVYFDDNHPLNVAKPVTGRATNNVGEIQAACEAIRIAKRCKVPKLCLNTDSQFLINAVTSWMPSWKRNNWKLQKGGMVKNVEDFKVLDELIKDSTLEIRWNYVKGHAAIKGNEEADKLARHGAHLYATKQKQSSK